MGESPSPKAFLRIEGSKMINNGSVLNRQEPVEKHRIKKQIFDLLDPLCQSIARELIDEGRWEMVEAWLLNLSWSQWNAGQETDFGKKRKRNALPTIIWLICFSIVLQPPLSGRRRFGKRNKGYWEMSDIDHIPAPYRWLFEPSTIRYYTGFLSGSSTWSHKTRRYISVVDLCQDIAPWDVHTVRRGEIQTENYTSGAGSPSLSMKNQPSY